MAQVFVNRGFHSFTVHGKCAVNRLAHLSYARSIQTGRCLRQDDPDKPIQFSKSKASSWKASTSRSGEEVLIEPPSYQPYVVSGSLAIFLLYFCFLREENDVDEDLALTLYDRVPGLEQKQLELTYEYNKAHGIDNTDVKRRLKEIYNEKEEE